MSKKLQVKVNGKPFDVAIDDLTGSVVNVNVNGKSYEVEFEETGAPVAAPVVKPVQSAAPAAAPARAAAPVAAPSAPVAAGEAVTAPMPGVILDLAVKVGDKVTVGQQVCALEAMKMKNIIRSQREGTVASVDVSDGQRVAFGAVIIRFA